MTNAQDHLLLFFFGWYDLKWHFTPFVYRCSVLQKAHAELNCMLYWYLTFLVQWYYWLLMEPVFDKHTRFDQNNNFWNSLFWDREQLLCHILLDFLDVLKSCPFPVGFYFWTGKEVRSGNMVVVRRQTWGMLFLVKNCCTSWWKLSGVMRWPHCTHFHLKLYYK